MRREEDHGPRRLLPGERPLPSVGGIAVARRPGRHANQEAPQQDGQAADPKRDQNPAQEDGLAALRWPQSPITSEPGVLNRRTWRTCRKPNWLALAWTPRSPTCWRPDNRSRRLPRMAGVKGQRMHRAAAGASGTRSQCVDARRAAPTQEPRRICRDLRALPGPIRLCRLVAGKPSRCSV